MIHLEIIVQRVYALIFPGIVDKNLAKTVLFGPFCDLFPLVWVRNPDIAVDAIFHNSPMLLAIPTTSPRFSFAILSP